MARHAWISVIAALGLLPAMAAAAETEHRHHADAGKALVSQLQLNAGEKWATDASLRAGMSAIRTDFDAHHARIHASSETDAQYGELATSVEKSVNRIVEQCKLPPAADAQLHFIVGDLLRGVTLMRGSDPEHSRHDGAALVHGALNAYGKYFDDPTWSSQPPTKPAG
jgi:hypothetical protein